LIPPRGFAVTSQGAALADWRSQIGGALKQDNSRWKILSHTVLLRYLPLSESTSCAGLN
jgi:hypothetical protein